MGENNTRPTEKAGNRALCLVICVVAILIALFSVGYCAWQMSQLHRLEGLRDSITLPEDGIYTKRDDVAAYIYKYGHLPANYMTKDEAQLEGWIGGSLEMLPEDSAIGGDRIYDEYNDSLAIVRATGRLYRECDVNFNREEGRGSERLVYSNDGLIYYTPDHYSTFELLYGQE